jgi:hypothetical protein
VSYDYAAHVARERAEQDLPAQPTDEQLAKAAALLMVVQPVEQAA